MKHWPPLPAPSAEPLTHRRIPAFHPVPVGPRADGWTAERQAAFVGKLAETRSVLAAARAVGMGRESAYRLRKRPGAAGFAAAWDAALGKPHRAVDLSNRKATGLDAAYRLEVGLLQVVMNAGRFAGSYWKDDNNALLQHLGQIDRACRASDLEGRKSQLVEPDRASRPGVDFAPRGGQPGSPVPAVNSA
jgi:hypothetical protein